VPPGYAPDRPVYSPAPPTRNQPPDENPGATGFAPIGKKSEDKNGHNFCVRTPFLANLGFLKS
jgi:hypothetical protein